MGGRRPMSSPMTDVAVAGQAIVGPQPGEVRPFDFRRPNKLNRDHLRNLQIVHETFARQFTTVLSSTLRAITHVSVTSIDQLTYDEYVRLTPNPTFMAILATPPWTGTSAFQLPLKIALTAIDLLLGGHGKGTPERSLTDIELGLMKNLIDRAMSELTYAFNSVAEVHPQISRHESNPQFAQIAAPSDMMMVVTFMVKINEDEGLATLCFPYTTLQPVLDSFSGNLAQVLPTGARARGSANKLRKALMGVQLDFRAEFPAVSVAAQELATLQPGDVIPLGISTETPITGIVGGVPTFVVRPARKGKRLACQILTTLPGADKALQHLVSRTLAGQIPVRPAPLAIEPRPGHGEEIVPDAGATDGWERPRLGRIGDGPAGGPR
jgi:flagellar motor switch protein FliM